MHHNTKETDLRLGLGHFWRAFRQDPRGRCFDFAWALSCMEKILRLSSRHFRHLAPSLILLPVCLHSVLVLATFTSLSWDSVPPTTTTKTLLFSSSLVSPIVPLSLLLASIFLALSYIYFKPSRMTLIVFC